MLFVQQFFLDFLNILHEMSPYLLLGFFFAGMLKIFIPQQMIERYFGGKSVKSVLYAAFLGVPLPLCSCGVIPTGVSIYRNGAGKGATVSFLISTPQTGVDSILVTYSLLGLPFAIVRPIVALVTGVFGGAITNQFAESETVSLNQMPDSSCDVNLSTRKYKNPLIQNIYRMFKYAFVDFLQDISKWLMIGLLLAALVSVLIPENFFGDFIGNMWLEMLIALLVSIPLYICATGSVPIAAVLMMKGLSPGAALVFLMAGPATNIATITVLRKVLGQKTTYLYLISIISGAFVFGLLINYLLPETWFAYADSFHLAHEHHSMLPQWLKISSSILLIGLMINGYVQKIRKNKSSSVININKSEQDMEEIKVNVKGMNCNHCKASVEKNVLALPNIEFTVVDLNKGELTIKGKDVDLEKVKHKINDLGFEYGGEL
ncbi:MAG: heavy metal-associated domain-containing protein [Bacteroidetes bacterium]|nr:MAG: heavy metal-associated domain-containing protein [Bacteroidota bacterium]